MTRTDIDTIINHPDKIKEVTTPAKCWEFIGVDSSKHPIYIAVYKDKRGNLYKVKF